MNADVPREPDSYQQAWQAQASQTRVTIDANLLQTAVERSQGTFRAMILARDVREVGVAVVMLVAWFVMGAAMSLPWSWYLTAPALVWVAGFILVDRRRHPQRPIAPGEPLVESVRESLTQVRHQIWLLRNVFWWYLLPFTLGLLGFFCHVTWLRSESWWEALGGAGSLCVFVWALYSFIYYLNQRAVRVQLEPRRRELLTLLASLGEERTEDVAANTDAEENAAPGVLGRPMVVMALLMMLAILGTVLAVVVSPAPVYSQRAPYTGVRWEGETPVVKIGAAWFTLVSIDGVPVEEIVAFSQSTYGEFWRPELWRKRFVEDLVEVMTRMGHEPKGAVRLVVSPLGSSERQTLEDVPMTEANRWMIYRGVDSAAVAREAGETGQAEPLDSGHVDPARLEGRYQLNPNFVFDVRYLNGHMMVGITNQATYETFPQSPRRWAYRAVDATLEFHVRAEGPAYALTLHQNGAAQRAVRVSD